MARQRRNSNSRVNVAPSKPAAPVTDATAPVEQAAEYDPGNPPADTKDANIPAAPVSSDPVQEPDIDEASPVAWPGIEETPAPEEPGIEETPAPEEPGIEETPAPEERVVSVQDMIRGRSREQETAPAPKKPAAGSMLKSIIASRTPAANKVSVLGEIRNRKAGRASGSSVSQVIFDRRYRVKK